MKITKILLSVLLIAFGVFMFIYGGYDDSPGAQLLGLMICILGIVSIIRNKKKSTR